MKVAKSIFLNEKGTVETSVRTLEVDVRNLHTALQGRLRFGAGTNGARGENLQGRFQQFTSHGTANTEFTVAHGLGATPVGRIVLWQDKAGSLYQGPSTGTPWDITNAYLKCDVISVTFLVFFIM